MKNRGSQPPRLAKWLMEKAAGNEERKTIVGDMDECFEELRKGQGKWKSDVWYWSQVGKSTPALLKNSVYWRAVMFKNYLKVALRIIQKHKIYSAINITGLSVGLACCLLIFLYVSHESSFDRYHDDADRIYRIVLKIERESAEMETARVSTPLIPILREGFPDIESAARFQNMDWRRNLVEFENKRFYENRVMVAENDLFQVLTIPFSSGDPASALSRPDTVVISKSMSTKYFGHRDPLGLTLNIWDRPFEVTGVVLDPPDNTHVKYGFILSLNGFERIWNMDNWGWTGFYALIKLKSEVDPLTFERKIEHIADKYIPEDLREWGATLTYSLQPIKKIHLYSNLSAEVETPGNPAYLYIFSIIGLLILLLSVINFTNLTTARSAHRSREVGIRKVVGAQRNQLRKQFLGESYMIAFISAAGALTMSVLALSVFNGLTGKEFTSGALFRPVLLSALFCLALLVGLTGGIYPAFVLSLFRPVSVLKGTLDSRTKGILLRKILVLGQYAVTIVLITGTLVVYKQIDFMKNEHLGFDKEQKLIIPADFRVDPEAVKAEFLGHPSISAASACWSVPGRTTNRIEAKLVGQADSRAQSMDFLYVDADFIPDYKIDMVAGRAFRKETLTDVRESFVLNETATDAFGFASPQEAVGIRMYEGGSGRIGTIIGVTADFHFKGLQTVVEPLVLQLNPDFFTQLSLTVRPENLGSTLSFIEDKWNELRLGSVFSYFFLDEDFNRQYNAEERVGRLAVTFTLLALFVSCLGLVGLSSYTAEQRTKEIGIRKVLGASVPNILVLLTKEFTLWVLMANLIAWPLGYLFMNSWLHQFAYRTALNPVIFFVAGASALVIALLTVSFQSVRAAVAEPVDSLRYE